MGNCVGVEPSQPEVGRVVHKATILGSQGDVFNNGEIRAAAILKHTGRLSLCTCHRSEGVARRIKHERASFREHVWADPEPGGRRDLEDEAAGGLVNIGLNSR